MNFKKGYFMKNLFIVLFIIVCSCSCVYAFETDSYSSNDIEFKEQLSKLQTKHIIIFNDLLLSDLQKAKANYIFKNSDNKEAEIYAKLKKEQNLLNNLIAQSADKFTKKQQKKNIRKLEKEILIIEKQADREFKKILNHDQRTKYNRIKKTVKI